MSAARHPLLDELELYVLGALDGEIAVRLERHVRRCPPCAAALAEEARLETTLRALVPAMRAPAKVVHLPAPRSAPRPRTSLSGALAAAAAILVAVWGLGSGRGGGPSNGVAVAVPGEGPVLACELEGEAPLCRWPGLLAASMAAPVTSSPIDEGGASVVPYCAADAAGSGVVAVLREGGRGAELPAGCRGGRALTSRLR